MEREEQLRKLVQECKSFREALKRLGKVTSGASLRKLKDELELYGIDYKFMPEKTGGIRAQIPLEQVLKEGVDYCSKDLKKRLIKAGLKKDICELCGTTNQWNGQPLTLHLDHINGNHIDNRLENLRVLCPNCHSQTSTYAGRNTRKRKVILCCDCGKEIKGRLSTRCCSCAAKLRERTKGLKKPSKLELVNSLKARGIAETARYYQVTYNAVRKWCVGYKMPHTKKEIGEYLNTI